MLTALHRNCTGRKTQARRRFPSNDDPKDWENNLKRIDEYYAWINKNYNISIYSDLATRYFSIIFDLLEARKAIFKIARRKVFEDAAEYIPNNH
ncbi:hypothetical protein PRIPAC_90410 [Pristionchus pacificus]|uniref:Uncharacterized protein n=1 Tax=Pristionchus pacificus TaxID=54126 RepID=A0A2A6B9Q8_PRIPA|nr:hypothetical protein PRIPAC_90410 [Pristionchus pacificus]|eukprot:PDM62622.1 hypothetical protein PRIPAC_52064 [Pristionchus pacificus]